MFDGLYLEWNHKRAKVIVDHFGHQFFYGKKVLDLGCGHGDMGAAFYRLGADVTCVDARNEHLKVASKKFPGIKVVKSDLDKEWSFNNFDLVLNLDLICHIKNFENHLRNACYSTSYIVVETAVCDSDIATMCPVLTENKDLYDWSFNGFSSRPTAAMVERIFTECGMEFKRFDSAKLNISNKYLYDWNLSNTGTCDITKRRFWIATRTKAVPPNQPVLPLVHNPIHLSAGMLLTPGYTITSPILPAQMSPQIPNQIDERTAPQFLPANLPRSFFFDDGNPIVGTKKFVVVIPSYKNSHWCERNIISVINQNYDKYRVIFTDDCSPDDTFDKVYKTVVASDKRNKFNLIKNTTRIGALANLYNMIHSCDDDEIILTLDGDDWFPDNRVLAKLDQIYSSGDIWLTYGQYKNHPDGAVGISQPYPRHIIDSASYRQFVWCASHLRTFYAWLFKKIKKEDLMYNGDFLQMTWDFAMMFPMLEMSAHHAQFVSEILYIYNLENPINDHKVNQLLQQSLDRYMRSLPKYQPVEKPNFKKPAVGVLLIATSKYNRFIQGFINSADKYFLNNKADVTYYVFTDNNHQIQSDRKIVYIPIAHRPFPFASMDRFKHFSENAERFANEDYLFYCDVDTMIVDNISTDILGDLVGVRHCGYYKTPGPVETNTQSSLYVDASYPKKYKYYFGGGFSGGKRNSYLTLSKWCAEMIDSDVSKGIIPVWHDETALNRYFLDHEPETILTPSYHYPQSNIEWYKGKWMPDSFNPKILLLDKDHHSIRT